MKAMLAVVMASYDGGYDEVEQMGLDHPKVCNHT
jgi:hypothetical protein